MYGCVNTATIDVLINPLPIVGTKGSTLCATKSISLEAYGGISYQWNGPLGYSSTGGTVQIPDATTDMAGEYTVTVTDNNGCKGYGVVSVSINPIPAISINSNSTICANATLQLTADAPTATQYFWSGPANFLSILQNPPVDDHNQSAAGVYTVYVNDQLGCSSFATVNVIVRPSPTVNLASDKLEGCVPLCINLNPTNSTNLSFVNWEFGDGNIGYGFTVYSNNGSTQSGSLAYLTAANAAFDEVIFFFIAGFYDL